MEENKIELTPDILDTVSGGTGTEDVYATLEGLVKRYAAMGFSL